MYESNHLAKHLRTASLKQNDAVFIHNHENDQLISFEDFFQNAEKIASALISAGIQPGDRVAMQVEKSYSALELYFGAILSGAGFLPLNTAYVPEEIDFFLRDAQPYVFVCDPAKLRNLNKIAKTAYSKKSFNNKSLDDTSPLLLLGTNIWYRCLADL